MNQMPVGIPVPLESNPVMIETDVNRIRLHFANGDVTVLIGSGWKVRFETVQPKRDSPAS